MTAPETVDVVRYFRQLDRDAAELDMFRATLARAVSGYLCACGESFEFTAESTIDDYAALNRWLGRHDACEDEVAQNDAGDELPITYSAHCPCGSTLTVRGEMSDDDCQAADDFASDHADCVGPY